MYGSTLTGTKNESPSCRASQASHKDNQEKGEERAKGQIKECDENIEDPQVVR